MAADQIPYIESGTYVACNDENGGIYGIVDLDTDFSSLPEWISMKAMVSTWFADAIMYELWVGSDGTSARTISTRERKLHMELWIDSGSFQSQIFLSIHAVDLWLACQLIDHKEIRAAIALRYLDHLEPIANSVSELFATDIPAQSTFMGISAIFSVVITSSTSSTSILLPHSTDNTAPNLFELIGILFGSSLSCRA
ncbi:LOW QUALITY PROTEIN: hypothetical protein NC653_040299 [Populus alba x Populus x berolinensis]|uniref:Uncharacterized protein n=1 Tax=Populus alba x Populus x berolinensis TaxID=444605 RepID=A0AAD6PRH0_9ROSI|nr:LOW QUALITY PROTEIN: hypothetical protein NC653_040299 [Populus alba x Populus x berolinensis]